MKNEIPRLHTFLNYRPFTTTVVTIDGFGNKLLVYRLLEMQPRHLQKTQDFSDCLDLPTVNASTYDRI